MRFLQKVSSTEGDEWPYIVSATDGAEILPIKVSLVKSVIPTVGDFKRCLDSGDLRGAVASVLQHSLNDTTNFDNEYKVQYQI